jgi:hypothetical protein
MPQSRHLAAAQAAAAKDYEDYIRKLVDQAPPLTAAQRDRLAVLFRAIGKGISA